MSLTIGADGSLTETGPPTELASTGVGFISIGPDGKHVYAPVEGADAVQVISVGADGHLTVTGSAPAENPGTSAVSPDGRFLLHGYDDGSTGLLGSMSIGPGGDLTPLGSTVLWKSGEPTRPQFLPHPAPVASFLIKRGAPGGISKFSAVGSARATRFDWDFGDGTVEKNGGPLTTHIYRSAGVYRVTLTVADAQGCSTQQIYTGQSTTCPGGASAAMTGVVDTLPAITRFAIKPRKFVPGTKKKMGTRFRYTLTEKAKVRFTILRRRKGKRGGRKFSKVGVVTASGRSGKNRTRFTGILKGKALSAGDLPDRGGRDRLPGRRLGLRGLSLQGALSVSGLRFRLFASDTKRVIEGEASGSKRTERVVFETDRHLVAGDVALPSHGYESRFSDAINREDVAFLRLTDVELIPLGEGQVTRHEFLLLAKAHIRLARPAARPALAGGALAAALGPGREVEEEREADDEPLEAVDAVRARAPQQRVGERRPRQQEEAEDRHEPAVEGVADQVREDQDEEQRQARRDQREEDCEAADWRRLPERDLDPEARGLEPARRRPLPDDPAGPGA